MTTSGTVIASIAAGVCTSIATGVGNRASTSTDNTVDWLLIWDYDWDFSLASRVATSGGNFASVTDNIAGIVATKINGNNMVYPSGTQNGLNFQSWGISGVAFGDGSVTTSVFSVPQPFTVQWVTQQNGGNIGHAITSATGANAPAVFAIPSGATEDYRMVTSSTLTTGNFPINTWQVITCEFDGNTSNVYVGNTLAVSGSLGNLTGITGGLVLFNNQAGSNPLQISDHAQIRIRAGVLTALNRDDSIDEMQAKWATA
jgi:hypothetical protein